MSPRTQKSKAAPTQVTVVRDVPFHSAARPSSLTTRPPALAPLPRFDPKCCTGNEQTSYLQLLEQHIAVEYQAYASIERDAARRAVKMGLLLQRVKDIVGHGEFIPWIEAHLCITPRAGQRFMKLAEYFLANAQIPHGETLLLGDGTATKEAKQAEQLLLDFVGNQSQAELFAKYGVAGGKREGSGRHRTQDEIDRDLALNFWHAERMTELESEGLAKKSWTILKPPELTAIATLFARLALEMKAALKSGMKNC